MHCPRGDHGLVVRSREGQHPVLGLFFQWHCIQCGWRDDGWRDEANCVERERQRVVVRKWFAKKEQLIEKITTRSILFTKEEDAMPMTDKGRWNIANGQRKRHGQPAISFEEFMQLEQGQKPAARSTPKEEGAVPGRFVATPGQSQLVPMEVNFLIGRTAGDWAAFVALWKQHFSQFRLNLAQPFGDEDTQMKVVLSPETE